MVAERCTLRRARVHHTCSAVPCSFHGLTRKRPGSDHRACCSSPQPAGRQAAVGSAGPNTITGNERAPCTSFTFKMRGRHEVVFGGGSAYDYFVEGDCAHHCPDLVHKVLRSSSVPVKDVHERVDNEHNAEQRNRDCHGESEEEDGAKLRPADFLLGALSRAFVSDVVSIRERSWIERYSCRTIGSCRLSAVARPPCSRDRPADAVAPYRGMRPRMIHTSTHGAAMRRSTQLVIDEAQIGSQRTRRST